MNKHFSRHVECITHWALALGALLITGLYLFRFWSLFLLEKGDVLRRLFGW